MTASRKTLSRTASEFIVRDRDVRLFRIYEGTSQIQQLLIARETLRQLQ